MNKTFEILSIACLLIAITTIFTAAQDDTPNPVAEPSISVADDQTTEAKMKTRTNAVKFWLRVKVAKEKRKLFRRDADLIAKYETILESPEIIEYIVEKSEKDFENIETKYFEGRGSPSAKEFGDGALLDRIIEFIENGGLEKILAFIIGIIDAIA